MKSLKFFPWADGMRNTRRCLMITTTVAMIISASGLARAGGTVTNCDASSLLAALADGGTVTFACDGTINLGRTPILTNTVVDATGHEIIIGGGFYIVTNVALTVTNLTIGNDAADAGAAIYNQGGQVTLENCRFLNNTILGTAGNVGSPPYLNGTAAYGGAIFNSTGGVIHVHNCLFSQNSVHGGDGYDKSQQMPGYPGDAGGSGGAADGGAICNWGQAQIQSSLFLNNSAVGGNGGGGQNGGVSGDWPYMGGPAGAGGDAEGAAVFNGGTIALVNCTFVGNSGRGGASGKGGIGGALWWKGVYHSAGNGSQGYGGSGVGAICTTTTTCFLTNCTLANNFGSTGTNTTYLTDGVAGAFGFANGGAVNCLFAFNTPSNFCGMLTDAGHNLSSDASIALGGTGSRTNLDPMLGPLANHGGPTLTMALLPGSPAIDAGSAIGAPPTDQRGIARPQGPAVDIGAYEFQYVPFFSGAAIQNRTNFQLQLAGLLPNQNFSVQASSNFVNWLTLTNCVFGTNGVFQFCDPVSTNFRTRFYRFSTP